MSGPFPWGGTAMTRFPQAASSASRRHFLAWSGGLTAAGALAAAGWTISDLMDEVVGPERSAYQWPVRSAVEAGIAVRASSEAPITEPDWRQGVVAMMLRESKASGRPSGPGQCVGLAEAQRAYTVNAARQDFAEEWKGTVETGKVADLCVLDRPLLGLDPHAITDAEVDLTVFDGRIGHER